MFDLIVRNAQVADGLGNPLRRAAGAPAPGLLATWVNGVKVFDGDDDTRVTPPGQVLTRFTGAPPRVGMQAR